MVSKYIALRSNYDHLSFTYTRNTKLTILRIHANIQKLGTGRENDFKISFENVKNL